MKLTPTMFGEYFKNFVCGILEAILLIISTGLMIVMDLVAYILESMPKILVEILRIANKLSCFTVDTLSSLLKMIASVLLPLIGKTIREGNITMSNGQHKIDIFTHARTYYGWISLCDQSGIPICHGATDKIKLNVKRYSLAISADIQSNSREIRWMAIVKLWSIF